MACWILATADVDAPALTVEELEGLKAHAWPRNFYQ